MSKRPMLPIPVSAAKAIAEAYGYDQVIVIARRVGEAPDPHGEHVTTFGLGKAHCDVAARTGKFLRTTVMGWDPTQTVDHGNDTAKGKRK